MKAENSGKIIVVVFLTMGVFSTFAYKLQGSQRFTQGQNIDKPFYHPYIQSMTMFIAESIGLILFFGLGKKAHLPLQQGKTPHKRYIFIIPACSDALSSMLQYMALSMISGSNYMMFKGASIVTTALFSKMLFGMVIQKRHLAGCGLAILGLLIVGASGLVTSDNSGGKDVSSQLLGYLLMIISLIFNGFLYAYEQKLMRQHTIHPLEMVGFQGISGVCILTIVITILSYVHCGFGVKKCVYDDNNQPFMELPLVYLREVFSNGFLIFLVFSGILSIAVYNFCGVTITKIFDALTRSLLNVTKTAVIWFIGILITVFATSEAYKLEDLNIWVNLIKAVGFTSIIFGTLIYNKLIFKKYFQSKVQERTVLVSQADIDSVLTNQQIGDRQNAK